MADEQRDKLNIRLPLYDTVLSVKIPRADEQLYRESATLISEVVGSYSERYKGLKSDKDILYMALVDIALRYRREAQRNDTSAYETLIEQLSTEIEGVLKGQNK